MSVERNALVGDIRRFNRFYTGLIGLLDETLAHSAYTLTEARVLFELDAGRALLLTIRVARRVFLRGCSISISGRRPPNWPGNCGSNRLISPVSCENSRLPA
ncbi:hypothetical protein AJ88_07860 [Mesorhizobium amorphae CCBAU 01583]|nr:hypothetical protein AJ88_07860 [Mesorhizobium amorphae CCBAU 01583]